MIVLSPFEVTTEENESYAGATTLAGNRLNTELRDIGNAVTVVTAQMLKDLGATDNKTLLQYTTNTEVGGFYGNFAGFGDGNHLSEDSRFINPNSNTRIRGLTAADNTREYFLTDIPWEGYNVDGVDLQRGPNSILFGQGSPAGIINTRLKQAAFKDSNEVSFRFGSWGSTRATLDVNKVLLDNQLAVRVAAVRNDEKYKQDPAFALQKRLYGAVRYEPGFLKKGGSSRTIFKANIEFGDIDSNNPRQLPPVDRITPWFDTGTYDGHDKNNDPFAFPSLNRMTINGYINEDDNTGGEGHGLNRPAHNGPGGVYAFWTVDGVHPVAEGTAGATFVNQLIPKYANDPTFASGKFAGSPNEYWQPWISGSLLGAYGAPSFVFLGNDATQGTAVNWEPVANHGMSADGSNGTRNNSITHYIRAGGIEAYSTFAQNARLYYNDLPTWQFGVYKDKSITDPSVFNFYNNLFDGPTKHEFQNFRNYNLSLAQTFLNDQVGFEAVYSNEWYKSGKMQLLTNDSLNIDLNRVYTDGSVYGTPVPYDDGTPNPNLGKAYVGGNGFFGNNTQVSNREAGRFTAFIDHDFGRDSQNWFTKLIGRHTVTGLLAGDRQEISNRSWARYSVDDPAYEALTNGSPDDSPKNSWTGNAPFTFIYLGDSLLNASSASGAHIPNPKVNPDLQSGSAINFDATWTPSTNPADPSYVDPGAFWRDPYVQATNPIAVDGFWRDNFSNPYPVDANGIPQSMTVKDGVVVPAGTEGGTVENPPYNSTQSENPRNYVGFRSFPINILDSLDSQAAMDRNTYQADLNKSKVFSRAFNWQGHFWNNALVGTWGVRKDIASAWSASINTNQGDNADYNRIDLSQLSLNENPNNKLEVTSHAWTAVAHLNQLPGLDRLPLQVSLFYNHSTDFQPAAQRVDVYGEPLAAPSGKTKDLGVLLETKDGKYSLKVNKYTTQSVGASSSGLNGIWFIGSSQAWAGNWVNRYEFNWTNDTEAGAIDPTDPSVETNTIANYEAASGETAEQAKARENSVIAAWRAWQASVDPRFYQAWQINLNDHSKGIGASVPSGFAVPEDSISKGYEIELNALPTRNWRVAINASQTTAQRKNIGGANLQEFMAAYTSFLGTGAPGTGGDLRIWWGGAGNETVLTEWNGNVNSSYNQLRLAEGTNVPELRKWRFNAITNYSFDEGRLKGINVGGGVRYESSVGIGYEPIAGTGLSAVTFDIANPYRGPSDKNFDFWVGYQRRLWSDRINWSIQLNIRNIGVGNELVPITTEPGGGGATYRIRPPQSWLVTNTISF